MEQLLQIAINHQHVRPSRWKDRKGAFDQALHLIRLQLLGIQMPHHMAEAHQFSQTLGGGGIQQRRPNLGGHRHPIQQAPVPVSTIGWPTIEHPTICTKQRSTCRSRASSARRRSEGNEAITPETESVHACAAAIGADGLLKQAVLQGKWIRPHHFWSSRGGRAAV